MCEGSRMENSEECHRTGCGGGGRQLQQQQRRYCQQGNTLKKWETRPPGINSHNGQNRAQSKDSRSRDLISLTAALLDRAQIFSHQVARTTFESQTEVAAVAASRNLLPTQMGETALGVQCGQNQKWAAAAASLCSANSDRSA